MSTLSFYSQLNQTKKCQICALVTNQYWILQHSAKT